MTEKRCPKCHETKDRSCFPPHHAWCRMCFRASVTPSVNLSAAVPQDLRLDLKALKDRAASVSWWVDVSAAEFARVAASAEVLAIIASGRFGRLSKLMNPGVSETT